MENNELKDALDALTVKLEGKTAEQVKEAVDAFKEENKDLLSVDVKGINERLDGLKDVNTNIEAMQKHLDTLDVKLQDRKAGTKAEQGDFIAKSIAENFDTIKQVERGDRKKYKFDVKAVGNMTLTASLTGDQPRDYNFNPVSAPSPTINVSDLVGVRQISGGTYTYVRVAYGEGSISDQTEGSSKSQIDYDYTMVDVNTEFLAGFARYSRKMANNLPFLQSSLPVELRRDYLIAENAKFEAVLASDATASTLTSGNEVERLLNEVSILANARFGANGIVINPLDFFKIITTEKSTGAGYGLPGVVTVEGGQLRINGIPVFQADWVAENKYYVGDWSRVNKIVTEGLSLAFSEEEGTNFVNNMITARIEEQNAIAVEQPAALIYGDFTTVV